MDNQSIMDSNERTLVMFDSVCSGLSACLDLVHADIKQMTEHRNKLVKQFKQNDADTTTTTSSSSSSFNNNNHNHSTKSNQSINDNNNKNIIYDINRQTRLAMQYSKQIEANLFKVEDLKSKYQMHLKMGLIKNSQGLVIKEFIKNIDRIETEFEPFMGSFLLAIEDIQGFARVCQGDVFGISIKYGQEQKFKTKIRVLKDYVQKCDNRQTVFKAKIADVLSIKAYECKGALSKRVLLGHKLCETRDLFTARSQLMTISLNQIGSIKLNLIVTWNPLHLSPNSSTTPQSSDISHISLPPTPVSSSTLSSRSSLPSLNGTTTTINIQTQREYNNCSSSRPSSTNHRSPAHYDDHHDVIPTTYQQHHQQQQQNHHHHNHHNKQPHHGGCPLATMYQSVDPTYGYYIPPPDYAMNTKIRDTFKSSDKIAKSELNRFV